MRIESPSPIVNAFRNASETCVSAVEAEIPIVIDCAENTCDDKTRKRSLQQVSTKKVRKEVIAWMIKHVEKEGAKFISSSAVKEFPQHFRGNLKANLQKTSRW